MTGPRQTEPTADAAEAVRQELDTGTRTPGGN